MSQTTRQLDSKQVFTIMNRRMAVPADKVGKNVRLTIRGNGNTIDVKNKAGELIQSVVEAGTLFQKVIFNLDANSGIAMKSLLNKDLSTAAIKAERAGDKETASKLFSDFLNAVQMSFSVPTTAKALLAQLGDRVEIIAKVVMVTTENGSLLTIDPNTIRVAQPEELAPTVFSFDAEEDAPVVADFTAEELAAQLAAEAAELTT